MERTEMKTSLLLAITHALNALGWIATLDKVFGQGVVIRIPGFPNIRQPEVRSKPSGLTLVWCGYTAKKPEVLAARIAKELSKMSAEAKVTEAAREVPLYLNKAERTLLEMALRRARPVLTTTETETLSKILEKIDGMLT